MRDPRRELGCENSRLRVPDDTLETRKRRGPNLAGLHDPRELVEHLLTKAGFDLAQALRSLAAFWLEELAGEDQLFCVCLATTTTTYHCGCGGGY
jgi:hypothetical protein